MKPTPSAQDAAPAKTAKAKRLTSWQRKAQRKRTEKEATDGSEARPNDRAAAGGTEASLNQAAASAKLASAGARERHRLGQAALPGDAELVAAYLAAKKAMRELHQAKPEGAIGKKKQRRKKSKGGEKTQLAAS